MDALLFANLTRKTLSTQLAGPPFDWKDFIQGDEMRVSLRLTQMVNGEDVEVDRTVTSLVAALGHIDVRPSAGTFALKIDNLERTFTADASTDTLTAAGHGFSDGQRLRLLSTHSLPTPLVAGRTYYVVAATTNTFQLALAAGGAALDLFDAGTGTQSASAITGDISFDPTTTNAAQNLQDEINALPDVGNGLTFPECVVEALDGSWLVTFPGEQAAVDLVVAANSMRPVSFLRDSAYQLDGQWITELRPVQAPVAFTDSFGLVVPPAPTITAVQDGGENAPFVWNEVQALNLPPNFRGTYQIIRGFGKSELLSVDDGPEQIAAAIAGLADDGGFFTVTNPRPNVAHIEFEGEMGGIDQPLMTVAVFDAPQGDITFEFVLGKAEVMAILRDADDKGVKLPLEIQLTYEDPQDAQLEYVWTYRSDVQLRKELIWEGLATQPNIDWLRPPLPRDYVPFDPAQVITGAQHWVDTFGDGVQSTYVLAHGLNTEAVHVDIRENSTPGDLLVQGVDYAVEITSADSVTITVLGPVPGADTLAAVVTAAGPASAFAAHPHPIGQITGLQLILDDLGQRLLDLEALAPTGALALRDPDLAVISNDALPQVFEVYPALGDVTVPESGEFGDLNLDDDGVFPGGLLPAVHDASVDPVSGILSGGELPDPDSVATDQVWENQGVTDIDIFGGRGHRGEVLAPGDFVACDGNVFYRVENFGSESSYYPTKFNRLLWWIPVNEKQLRSKRQLLADFAIRTVMLRSDSAASWELVVLLGTYPADTTPGTPGPNLRDVVWDEDNPALSQQIIVGPVAGVHRFGARVANEGGGTITMDKIIYGDAEAAAATPATANFAIGAWLRRFDTENSVPNARGMVALSGLQAMPEGEPAPESLGYVSIF